MRLPIQRAGIEKARFLDLCEVLLLALNRAVAAGKALGPEAGLAELSNIPDSARLSDDPFYPAAQGEF
jgi:predicted RNA polymerase sigma factor